MKKLLIAALIILLAWNSILTYQIFNKKTEPVTDNPTDGTTVIQNNIINGYTTDITNVVTLTEPKVVSISAKNEDSSVTGSGVIYKVDGEDVFVVTNQHVIDEATEINITFANGEQLLGELVGADVLTDLAVIKVNPEFQVEAFKIGDSSALKKGEYCIAIGSPLSINFQGSTSFGIISNKDVSIPVDINDDGIDDWDMVVLQTDAAINPGNSGGPLINLNGDLIGITSMKITSTATEGLGFAIPVDEVTPIVDELIDTGTIVRPMLGISGTNISALTVYQKSYLGINMDTTKGVLVTDVVNGSPAEKAGIRTGDIIQRFDEVNIDDFKTFRKYLYSLKTGDSTSIIVLRNNNEVTIQVVLE